MTDSEKQSVWGLVLCRLAAPSAILLMTIAISDALSQLYQQLSDFTYGPSVFIVVFVIFMMSIVHILGIKPPIVLLVLLSAPVIFAATAPASSVSFQLGFFLEPGMAVALVTSIIVYYYSGRMTRMAASRGVPGEAEGQGGEGSRDQTFLVCALCLGLTGVVLSAMEMMAREVYMDRRDIINFRYEDFLLGVGGLCMLFGEVRLFQKYDTLGMTSRVFLDAAHTERRLKQLDQDWSRPCKASLVWLIMGQTPTSRVPKRPLLNQERFTVRVARPTSVDTDRQRYI